MSVWDTYNPNRISDSSKTLLGFRPVIVNLDRMAIKLEGSGHEIKPLRVMVATCKTHKKGVPMPECTCGFRTVLDPKIVHAWTAWDMYQITPQWHLMGIFQLVGKTLVDPGNIRSAGGFLWGLMKPDKMPDWLWYACASANWPATMRPVVYQTQTHAWDDVRQSWKNYKFKLPAWEEAK